MSTEQTEPIAHYGDDGHNAGGSSEAGESSSPERGTTAGNTGAGNNGRRRRRRRKNKSGSGSPAVTATAQQTIPGEGTAEIVSPAPASLVAVAVPAQTGQPQGGQFQGAGKRKKGRNRGGGASAPEPGNRDTRPQHQRQSGWKPRNAEGPDGNREGARGGFGSGEHFSDNLGNGNGGRRKGKFGGPRRAGFVGPMDHSYRSVNGNVADAPPSTMDFRNGNGTSHGRNDLRESDPVTIVKEAAPAKIVCFIEDLFVVAKMQEAARKLGVKIQFAKAEKETLAAITDAPDAERPSLIVFDLNNSVAKPLTSIPKLKAKLKRGTSIIGFLQQIQGDLKMKAIEAGCDTVMPKSAFSQNLPNLLRRHGLAEEEEEFAGV